MLFPGGYIVGNQNQNHPKTYVKTINFQEYNVLLGSFVTLSCSMRFTNYPFDEQNCHVQVRKH